MEPSFDGIVSLDVEPDEGLSEPYAVRVLVTGTTPLPWSKLFRARFDDQRVEAIAIDIYGTGFTGYVRTRPAEGARLIVEFDGQEPIDTGLAYSSNGSNV